jgi:hypothetical protein
MAMGIVVTGFTLFGMLALVILDAAHEEPTEYRSAKTVSKIAPAVPKAHPRKKAA